MDAAKLLADKGLALAVLGSGLAYCAKRRQRHGHDAHVDRQAIMAEIDSLEIVKGVWRVDNVSLPAPLQEQHPRES